VTRIKFAAGDLCEHRSEQQEVVLINERDLPVLFVREHARQLLRHIHPGKTGTDDDDVLVGWNRMVLPASVRPSPQFPGDKGASDCGRDGRK
jgi:hypothetical protein